MSIQFSDRDVSPCPVCGGDALLAYEVHPPEPSVGINGPTCEWLEYDCENDCTPSAHMLDALAYTDFEENAHDLMTPPEPEPWG